MKTTDLPVGTETVSVKITGNSPEAENGTMVLKRWTQAERTSRAFKKTARIVGTVLACSFIGLFVHLLLLIIIPSLLVTVVGAFPLFFKLQGQEATFFSVEGKCPYCRKEGTLRPYLNAEFKKRVTVQCSSCGQTAHVEAD